MQVRGFEYTDSCSPVATDISTSVMIVLTLYHKEEVWVYKLCDVKVAFLHTDMPVEIFIILPEGIVGLSIVMKVFLEEYCTILENLMYGNV